MNTPVRRSKRPLQMAVLAVVAGLAGYAGYLAWRAGKDIVTLHVRNEPLAKVMRSLRWQTWETFRWHKDLHGGITLDVDEMPLEQVLEIVGEQTGSRWTAVYPIYARKAALASLDRALRGEIDFSKSSFTNSPGRSFGPMRGGFADTVLNQNKLVSLQLTNKDLNIAALALSRVARARVMPENGVSLKVNLVLAQEPFDKAVAMVASGVKRSWTKLYALEPARGGFAGRGGPGGPGGPGGFGGGRPGGPGMPGGPDRLAGLSPEEREKMRARASELMSTLPPEERKEMDERRAAMQEMQNLPEDQRRALIESRMNSPEMQQRQEQRMASNIRNSTPEQRRERYERMNQMRKARAAGLPAGRGGR